MAPNPNQYGSISPDEHKDATLELLPHGPSADVVYNRTDSDGTQPNEKRRRHRTISYLLTAAVCLVSAVYWHGRAASYPAPAKHGIKVNNVNNNAGRVPMPPALSSLDPRSMKFRTVQREGLASPSKAWDEYLKENGDNGDHAVTPLPTNAWYLNLLSHNAADDPITAAEVAHVYTIPYILGVSPPSVPRSNSAMAGIELFLPFVKTSASNMQMVFDKANGVSLGALVRDKGTKDAPTSYQVDSSEPISPLGVSLRWNHVNMKSHVIRGMPYGTVRFGKDKNSFVLPKILSGDRPKTILIDSISDSPMDAIANKDQQSSSSGDHKILCGTFTGESVEQDPAHASPITSSGKPKEYTVQNEIIFHSDVSDFTWIVFFSKPVKVQCYSDVMPVVSLPGPVEEVQFQIDVTEVLDGDAKDDQDELVVRIALLNECTTGQGIIKEHCDHLQSLSYDTVSSAKKAEQYLSALRKGKDLYAKSPLVGTEFPSDDDGDENKDRVTNLVFDWDATPTNGGRSTTGINAEPTTSMTKSSLRAAPNMGSSKPITDGSFFMFALPHHLEALAESEYATNSDSLLCLHSFHGKTCLIDGSTWNLAISHGKPQSFLADRPPAAKAIPTLADAVNKDIKFEFSPNLLRGAADTYFIPKILAKVGRIIEITNELKKMQSGDNASYSDADESTIKESSAVAAEATLPLENDVDSLIDNFQTAVEIWLKPGGRENEGGEAEFLYDESWGGFVNCGCNYTFVKGEEGKGTCSNSYPECPAIDDVNADFGNGWYNDHHFHYGYMIYAAAIVAKNRPEWGREYYDRILLYIRDIANPSSEDNYFPMYRQKDFYLGNSWASGLMSAELSPHGREQESSSEAIAAWEGVALFGDVMMEAFEGDEENQKRARQVRNLGEFLTSMEVDAADRFYHIWGLNDNDKAAKNSTRLTSSDENTASVHLNTYPSGYRKFVVGMMNDSMASFQTWFSNEPVVSYGIQLMPLTAVAERRDDPEWVKLVYPIYNKSCKAADENSDGFCSDNGWSIIQFGLLAEIGETDKALEMASKLDEKVYLSDGGCGNSLSNTIWFISTRKVPSTSGEA